MSKKKNKIPLPYQMHSLFCVGTFIIGLILQIFTVAYFNKASKGGMIHDFYLAVGLIGIYLLIKAVFYGISQGRLYRDIAKLSNSSNPDSE